jgi:hypothetical protein
MLLKFVFFITICGISIKPIVAFIYSFEDAISLFVSSDKTFSKLDWVTNNQSTIDPRDLLCDQQFNLFADGLANREEWAVLSKKHRIRTYIFILTNIFKIQCTTPGVNYQRA